MSPKTVESSQEREPRRGHFVVRPTGEIVPLIAVDELPPGISIAGVPRSLDLTDTTGMINLGIDRSNNSFYKMYIYEVQQNETNPKEIARITSSPTRTRTSPITIPNRANSTPQTPRSLSTSPNSPRTPSPGSSTTSSDAASPLLHRQAQICRHWCKHGTCKWGTDCHFRHFMPMNLPGLQNVGLYDWPAWYRNLNPGCFLDEDRLKGEDVVGLKHPAQRLNDRVRRRNGENTARSEKGRVIDDRQLVRDVVRMRKREDLGDQVIGQLRSMHTAKSTDTKEHQEDNEPNPASKAQAAAMVKALAAKEVTARIERAAARDAKTWEEEMAEEKDDGRGGQDARADAGTGMKGILVDI